MKKLSEQFNNISVKKGEYFIVDLPSNGGSTGYMWDISVTAGKASVVKKEYLPLDPAETEEDEMACGRTMHDRTIMRADETGTIELSAEYRRPWEKGNPPAQQKTFKVTVQ
jgi:predicted secreted protein